MVRREGLGVCGEEGLVSLGLRAMILLLLSA